MNDFFVCDSEGNDIAAADSLDSAIRRAACLVLDVWEDVERAQISEQLDPEKTSVLRLYVERAGPLGTRRVRLSTPGAEWLAWEHDFALHQVDTRKR